MEKSIIEKLIEISHDEAFLKLHKYYYSKSFWEILGIARLENQHSQFFAWLLDPNESHGAGDFCIKRLLQTIIVAIEKIGQYKDNKLLRFDKMKEDFDEETLKNAIISNSCAFSDVKVEREKDLGGYGRLDIWITGKISYGDDKDKPFQIIIENKIKSSEGDAKINKGNKNDKPQELTQTQKYETWLLSECQDKDKKNKKETYIPIEKYGYPICVFLTPIPTIELKNLYDPDINSKAYKKPGSDKFFHLNYQLLMDHVLEPLIVTLNNGSIKDKVLDYTRALSYYSFEREKEDIFIATGYEEKRLLKDFYNRNEQFLLNDLLPKVGFKETAKKIKNSSNIYEIYYNKKIIGTANKSNVLLTIMNKAQELDIDNNTTDRINSIITFVKDKKKEKTWFWKTEDVYPSNKLSNETFNYENKEYRVKTNIWDDTKLNELIELVKKSNEAGQAFEGVKIEEVKSDNFDNPESTGNEQKNETSDDTASNIIKTFFDNNNAIFSAIFKYILDNEEDKLDDETRKLLENAMKSAAERDDTKYNIYYKNSEQEKELLAEACSKSNVLLTIMNKAQELDIDNNTTDRINSIITFVKDKKKEKTWFWKTEDVYPSNKLSNETFNYENKEYRVKTNIWDDTKLKKLIDFVKNSNKAGQAFEGFEIKEVK